MKILTKIAFFLFFIFLIGSPTSSFAKKNKVRTEIDTISALQFIIFDTAQGKIVVSLPEEILAGDMISGTITKEPKGKTQKDSEANLNKLGKYSIEINNETRIVSKNELKFSIPKSSTGGVTYMILRSANGEEWARNYITYQNSSIDIKNFEAPSPWEYQSPKIGRSTNPSVIKGPFDGNFGTTSIMIGNTTVKKIAESPRVLVFQNPSNPIGNLDLILNERGIEVKRKYNNITVVKLDENKSNTTGDKNELIAKNDQTDKPDQSVGDKDTKKSEAENSADKIKIARNESVSENKYGILKEAELPLEINDKEKTKENVDTKLAKKTASSEKEQNISDQNTVMKNNFQNPSDKALGKYTVQIASYKQEKDAIKLANKLQSKGYEVYITQAKIPQKGKWHRVRIGSYSTKNEADNFGSNLTQNEPLINSMFVTLRN
jgi:cell division septation protein DedD